MKSQLSDKKLKHWLKTEGCLLPEVVCIKVPERANKRFKEALDKKFK